MEFNLAHHFRNADNPLFRDAVKPLFVPRNLCLPFPFLYREAELPPFAIEVMNADKFSDTDMLLLEYTSREFNERRHVCLCTVLHTSN